MYKKAKEKLVLCMPKNFIGIDKQRTEKKINNNK